MHNRASALTGAQIDGEDVDRDEIECLVCRIMQRESAVPELQKHNGCKDQLPAQLHDVGPRLSWCRRGFQCKGRSLRTPSSLLKMGEKV